MISSLKLDPKGIVPVMQAVVSKQERGIEVSHRSGALAIELPVAQKFWVEVLDMRGRSVYQAAATGTKLDISRKLFPAGLYVVRVVGEKMLLQPRMVVLHP